MMNTETTIEVSELTKRYRGIIVRAVMADGLRVPGRN
jgi:hypothetical protein